MQQKRQSKRIINYILLLQLPLLLSIAITACGGGGDSPSVFNGDVTHRRGHQQAYGTVQDGMMAVHGDRKMSWRVKKLRELKS